MSNDICGTCTMCCKNLSIGDEFRGAKFRKPAGKWCPHCAVGIGCGVYAERPETCRTFQCVYHEAVTHDETIDPELRPDRCGVVLSGTTDGNLVASCDRSKPDAWRRGKIYALLLRAVRGGFRVTISTGTTERKLILHRKDGSILLSEMQFTPPDEKGMQWNIPGTGQMRERIE